MKFNIRISNSFLHGESNTPFAVDGPFLTDDEIKIIQRFLEDVANGRALVGKTSHRGLMITMIKFPAQTIMSKRIIGIIIVGQHGIQTHLRIIPLT